MQVTQVLVTAYQTLTQEIIALLKHTMILLAVTAYKAARKDQSVWLN
jgi:hypothetical protein